MELPVIEDAMYPMWRYSNYEEMGYAINIHSFKVHTNYSNGRPFEA